MYIGVSIDTVQNMCGNAEVYMAYLNYLLINKELITVSSKSALFHKFALFTKSSFAEANNISEHRFVKKPRQLECWAWDDTDSEGDDDDGDGFDIELVSEYWMRSFGHWNCVLALKDPCRCRPVARRLGLRGQCPKGMN